MVCFQELHFKKATLKDSFLLLKWANEEETRKQSFHTHKISMDEHSKWLRNILKDQNVVLLILYWREIPVGNIRFSIDGTCATLSYSIDNHHRGRGLGKSLIRLAVDYAKQNLPVESLRAETKLDNFASQKILLRNGFHEIPKQAGQEKQVFINDFSSPV